MFSKKFFSLKISFHQLEAVVQKIDCCCDELLTTFVHMEAFNVFLNRKLGDLPHFHECGPQVVDGGQYLTLLKYSSFDLQVSMHY